MFRIVNIKPVTESCAGSNPRGWLQKAQVILDLYNTSVALWGPAMILRNYIFLS